MFSTHREGTPSYARDFLFLDNSLTGIASFRYGTYTNPIRMSNVYQLVGSKTTTISSSSTDTQYPSAKAVYDYVDTMITQAIGGSY